jgi:hypothetical protein
MASFWEATFTLDTALIRLWLFGFHFLDNICRLELLGSCNGALGVAYLLSVRGLEHGCIFPVSDMENRQKAFAGEQSQGTGTRVSAMASVLRTVECGIGSRLRRGAE